jgi:glycerophosphoryl diester phosphodiesterase
MEEAVWREIDAAEAWDRVLVASAKHGPIERFRRVSGGRVATSASQREVVRFWAAAHSRLAGRQGRTELPYDALQIPMRWHGIPVVTRGLISAAQRRGLQVHVWTIDDPGEMRRLIGLGVDGIMTDRPDLLKQVLDTTTGL